MRAAILAASLILTAAPAASEEIDSADRYRQCLELALDDPAAAMSMAGEWLGLGGGVAAQHCQASALAGLGEHGSAAVMLEDLARDSREGRDAKLGMLRQAAAEWLAAGDADRAMAVIDAGLQIAPKDPDFLEDRALVKAAFNQYWEAVDDLDAAIEVAPRRPGLLVLRAAVYRALKVPDLAMTDIERALTLDPRAVDAFLERGLLKLEQGDPDGARQDWLTVLRLEPDGVAAEAAQVHIERLDVRVD